MISFCLQSLAHMIFGTLKADFGVTWRSAVVELALCPQHRHALTILGIQKVTEGVLLVCSVVHQASSLRKLVTEACNRTLGHYQGHCQMPLIFCRRVLFVPWTKARTHSLGYINSHCLFAFCVLLLARSLHHLQRHALTVISILKVTVCHGRVRENCVAADRTCAPKSSPCKCGPIFCTFSRNYHFLPSRLSKQLNLALKYCTEASVS